MAEPNTLEKFLIEKSAVFGTEEAVRELLQRLEPYRRSAKDGQLYLRPPSDGLCARAIHAIASASGQPIEHLVLAPMSPRCPSLEGIEVPDPECRFDVTMRLGTPPSEQNRLGRYRRHHEVMDPAAELILGFRHEIPDRLMFLFDEEIWTPLQVAIGESVTKWAWRKMSAKVWPECVRMNHSVVYVHIGYTLVGAVGAAAACEPWVELMPQAMPLGHAKNQPGSWYVAVG